MAKTVSTTFKAISERRDGRVDDIRVWYKRPYYNGSAMVWESDWQLVPKSDVVSISGIGDALDELFRNVYRISTVTLTLKNHTGKWFKTSNYPSLFAPDGAATLGYYRQRMKVRIEYGLQLPTSPATYEYEAEFTGLSGMPKPDLLAGTISIPVMSNAALLEQCVAADVNDAVSGVTSPPEGVTSPASANGVLTDFRTTASGVYKIDAVYVGGVLQSKTLYEIEDVDDPDQGALIKFRSAPAAGTISWTGSTWKSNIAIHTAVGLICDRAGIASGERSISDVVFTGGLISNFTIDTQTEWEAGTTLQNLATTAPAGSIVKRWHLFDDFTDGDTTASPVWTSSGSTPSVVSDGPQSNAAKLPSAGSSYAQMYAAMTKTNGTWRWKMRVEDVASAKGRFWFVDNAGGGYGYFLEVYRSGFQWRARLVRNTPSYLGGSSDTDLLDFVVLTGYSICPTNGWIEWRITRTASGLMEVFEEGVSRGTATDTDYTTSNYVTVQSVANSNSFVLVDDIYWSPAIDGTGAISTAAVIYEEEYDFGSTPVGWGAVTMDYDLNGGTVVVKTTSKTNPGDAYDTFVTVSGGVNGAALKRYAKVRIEITVDTASFGTSPEIRSITVPASVTATNLSLLILRGMNGWAAVQRLAQIADYEVGFKGDGSFFFRSKTATSASVLDLTNRYIQKVLDWDDGEDRVINVGYVTYGPYTEIYDGASAGEASPKSEDIYGRRLPSSAEGAEPAAEDYSDVLLAGDINLARGRAQLIYENGYLPRKRFKLRTRLTGWLESGDVVTLSCALDQKTLEPVYGDPLVEWGGESSSWGPSAFVLANGLDCKVLSRAVHFPQSKQEPYQELVLEEVLS